MKTVKPDIARQWLLRGEAVLVDVREPGEFRAAHIDGAHPLPLGAVSLAALPAHDGRKLLIHCARGGRGAQACEKLLAADPALDVYNLEGGLEAWAAAGHRLRRNGRHLPLDRQVQLAIGLLLLAGSLLAWFAAPGFVAIPALLGIGLTLAGLTGFCGLARVMAHAPWNS